MSFDFEILADFEVVWNGGALLPPRETVPDGRLDDLPLILFGEHDTLAKVKTKRMYHKSGLYKQRPLSEMPFAHFHLPLNLHAHKSKTRYPCPSPRVPTYPIANLEGGVDV